MILCLVTDRRRLGAAMGVPEGEWVDLLHRQVTAAAEAGVDYIQVREPDLEARELAELVRSLIGEVAAHPARILVNDRLDVALATRAAGVHLKEDSILPDRVRRIAPPDFVISCAIHGIDAVAARKSADLLIAGTVLPTVSKPAVDYLNREGLSRIVEAAAGQSVLGIGGLDLPSIPLLASSCAAGLAAIGAFIPAAGADVNEFVQNRVNAWRLAFDSVSRRT
jgi:thiamine-phosphate pyrophosphorylase